MSDAPAVTVRGMEVSREKNGARFTLRVPALDLMPGQMLAVVGQSGCGKSTLTDMIALILKPDRADEFSMRGPDGHRTDLMRADEAGRSALRGRDIGYVLQSGGLFPFLSVLENIMLPGKLLRLPHADTQKRARALAERLGIGAQLNKKPQYLSGGQRQRAAIARALVHHPRLVLADEPTAAVDQGSARQICELFREMARENRAALLVVSHDRQLMEQCADADVTFRLQSAGPDHTLSELTPVRHLRRPDNYAASGTFAAAGHQPYAEPEFQAGMTDFAPRSTSYESGLS